MKAHPLLRNTRLCSLLVGLVRHHSSQYKLWYLVSVCCGTRGMAAVSGGTGG